MKKLGMFLLILTAVLALTACSCEHAWEEATCQSPQVCTLCGERQGEPLEHTWMAADCRQAQTCSLCGEVQGEPLEHVWMDATTEEPRTCALCSQTQGERIITDPRFTTQASLPLIGRWEFAVELSRLSGELAGQVGERYIPVTCDFCNDGCVYMYISQENMQMLLTQLRQLLQDRVQEQMQQQGLDAAAAEELLLDTVGLTMEAYLDAMLEQLEAEQTLSGALGKLGINGVYYVEGESLFYAPTWDEPMTELPFLMEENSLSFPEALEELGCPVLSRLET